MTVSQTWCFSDCSVPNGCSELSMVKGGSTFSSWMCLPVPRILILHPCDRLSQSLKKILTLPESHFPPFGNGAAHRCVRTGARGGLTKPLFHSLFCGWLFSQRAQCLSGASGVGCFHSVFAGQVQGWAYFQHLDFLPMVFSCSACLMVFMVFLFIQ